MTQVEKLQQVVQTLSEQEAEQVLNVIYTFLKEPYTEPLRRTTVLEELEEFRVNSKQYPRYSDFDKALDEVLENYIFNRTGC